jgi:hypothetical protein
MRLKPLTFFRCCLLVPYAFGALIALSRPLLPAHPSEPWLTVLLFALLAAVIGAIPYGLIAFLLWIWLPGKSARSVRIAFAAAPLGLLAIVLAFNSLRFIWREALMVSYAYVALFLLTEQALRRLGFVRDDSINDLRVHAS